MANKQGRIPNKGDMVYKTTCLNCGWHKDCAVPYTGRRQGIKEHLEDCLGPVVITVRLAE